MPLGSIEDQRELLPLLTDCRSYRDCVRILGWPYGRVSEAARAIKGMPSDSRDGRRFRIRAREARRLKREALHASLAAYRDRIQR